MNYNWNETFDRYEEWYKWVKDTRDAFTARKIMDEEYSFDNQSIIMFPDIPARNALWEIQEIWNVNASERFKAKN